MVYTRAPLKTQTAAQDKKGRVEVRIYTFILYTNSVLSHCKKDEICTHDSYKIKEQ